MVAERFIYVQLIEHCIVNKAPHSTGEVFLLPESEARLLIGIEKAVESNDSDYKTFQKSQKAVPVTA